MSQRYIIKAVKQRRIDCIQPANRDDFRFRLLRQRTACRDKRMRKQYMPCTVIPICCLQRRLYRVLLCALRQPQPLAQLHRTQPRQQMKLHPAAVRVAQLHRFHGFPKGTGEVYALPREQGLAEIQPLAGVVVAADGEH